MLFSGGTDRQASERIHLEGGYFIFTPKSISVDDQAQLISLPDPSPLGAVFPPQLLAWGPDRPQGEGDLEDADCWSEDEAEGRSAAPIRNGAGGRHRGATDWGAGFLPNRGAGWS